MESLVAGVGIAGIVITVGLYGWPAVFASVSAILFMFGVIWRLGKVSMAKLEKQVKEVGDEYLRSQGVEPPK